MSQESIPTERLGPYRLIDRLGEGGMGVVHLAADPQGRKVALKVLRGEVAGDATARRRLAREVETMRRARSPYIAEIVDADVTGRRPYVVTEYVPGLPLDEVVKRDGPLEGAALQRFAAGLATALSAIHAAGVIHRDLKPGNVMMVDGNPVVIDFGIAHAVDSTRITQTGMFIGTPGYLAPEIIEGEEPGPGSDVHAWAATVLYACTGKPPFGSGSLEIVFYNITQGRANIEAIPEPMRGLVAAALARTPGERPSAGHLGDHIARLDMGSGPLDIAAEGRGLQDDRELQTRRVADAGADPIKTNRLGESWSPPAPTPPAPTPPGQSPVMPGAMGGQRPTPPAQQVAGRQMAPVPGYPTAPAYPGQPGPVYTHPRPAVAAPPTVEHRVISAMLLMVMVGSAVVLPIMVIIACLPIAIVLRAADYVSRRQGGPFADISRALRDAASLSRSFGVTVALIPYGFILGLPVTLLLALFAYPGVRLENAAGWGAAILLWTVCAGPGVESPKRQVAKILGGTLAAQGAARLTAAALGVLAFVVVLFALVNKSVWVPIDVGGLTSALGNLHDTVME